MRILSQIICIYIGFFPHAQILYFKGSPRVQEASLKFKLRGGATSLLEIK